MMDLVAFLLPPAGRDATKMLAELRGATKLRPVQGANPKTWV